MSDINLVLRYDNGNLKIVSKEAETELKNSAKKGTKEYKKEGEKGGKKFSEGFSSGVKAVTANIAKLGAAAAAAAVAAGTVFAAKSVKLAAQQEDAVNTLNSALSITGKLTQETTTELQNYASALQQASRFGDETILSATGLIQSLGNLEKDALKGATQAAVDLAAALKIDLRSAATLVGKAATGEIGSFSRYGVIIKKGSDNAETFANTLTALNSKFGGAAANDVRTYSGAVQQASNSFGDLLEKFGDAIVKNPVILKGLQERAALFDKLGKQFENFRTSGGLARALIQIIDAAALAGEAITTYLIRPLEVLFNVGKAVFFGLQTLNRSLVQTLLETALALEDFTGGFSFLSRISAVVLTSIKTGLGFIATGLVGLGQKLVSFIGLFTDVTALENKLEGFSDGLVEGVIDNSKKFNEELNDLFDNTNNRKADIKKNISLVADVNSEALDASVGKLNESLSQILDDSTTENIQAKLATMQATLVAFAEGTANVTKVAASETTEAVTESVTTLSDFFAFVGEGLTIQTENFGDIASATAEQLKATEARVRAFAKTTSTALRNGIGAGAGQAFAEFGKALVTGENALASFGKAFLKAIGGVLVQQGTAFILEGIAYSFSANPALQALGPGLISAGAGLAAFGGVLGAVASGGAGGAAVGGAAAGGTGGGFGGGIGGGDTIDEGFVGEERVQAQASTVLNINVEGNVVDQDTFTRRLVEDISDEGGKQGLTFTNFNAV